MSKIKRWTRALNRPCSGYDAQRAGQAFMNELYKLDPDFYNTVKGTGLDCFYKSEVLPKTMKAWMEHMQDKG